MEYCPYCYEPRGDKFSCCAEVHFEECTEEEYELMGETGQDLYEMRNDFESFVATHQHLRGKEE